MTRPRRYLTRLMQIIAGVVACVLLLLLGPLSVLGFGNLSERGPWWSASRESTGISPSPVSEPRAVVQVFAARTLGRRGAFAVHTWIATKRRGASAYKVHHVLGWRQYRGLSAVVSREGVPDLKWFGATPDQLVDLRGGAAESLIGQIEQAVADYPWANNYRVWPGPNSNSFTAFVGRRVPGLGLDLPPTAVGKDFLGDWKLVDVAPSGTGWQLSVRGLLGLTIAREEGVEINLLGLSIGIDFNDVALRLPGIGFVPLWPR